MAGNRFVFRLLAKDSARVKVRALEETLDDLTVILSEVEGEIAGRRGQLSWEIADLGVGSAILAIEPAAALSPNVIELASHVGHAVTGGLRVLANGAVRPQFFSNRALDHAARLARRLGDGLAGIGLSFDEDHVEMAPAVESNVRGILEYIETIGSVEGILEVIAGPEGQSPYFYVRESVYGNRVKCVLQEAMIQEALERFRKRVLVTGAIKYDSSGQPQSVRVESMESMPSQEQLPQPNDVRGILGDLSGMNPEDYVEYRFYAE